MQVVCLLVVLVFLVGHVAGTMMPARLRPTISASAKTETAAEGGGKNKWSVAVEEMVPAPGLFKRLPLVPVASVMAGLEGFLQTGMIMLPIGMIMNGKVLFKEGLKPWCVKGSKLSLDWGKVSALFAGGDKFFVALRGKEDEWNTILGSGLASGLLRVNEGPAAMLQGAMLGAGFVMAFSMLQTTPQETDAHFAQRAAVSRKGGMTTTKKRGGASKAAAGARRIGRQ